MSNFLEHLDDLSDEATEDDPLHIISYTPALGYLAQPERQWKRWQEFLANTKDNKRKAKIITIKEDQLIAWHQAFKGRKTNLKRRNSEIDDPDIMKCNGLCADIRKGMRSSEESDDYLEVDKTLLPGWYGFFTTRRAIVITPFFLPLTAAAGGLKVPKNEFDLPSPSVIGYQTTDRSVIENLQKQFAYITAVSSRNNESETGKLAAA